MRCPDCGSHMDMEEGVGFICAHCGTDTTPEDFTGRSNSTITVIEEWRTSCIGCGKVLWIKNEHIVGDYDRGPVVMHSGIEYGSCPGCGTDVDQIILRGAA